MQFFLICVGAIVLLGVIAAFGSIGSKDDEPIQTGHDCSTCSSIADGSCKIGCLMEEKKRQKDNKKAPDSVN